MQNNLLIENEGLYKPQDLNQPNVVSPAPQPHPEPVAQIPTQPYYIQPITQVVPQPYIIQTSQPYIVQVAPQQYAAQPYYLTQPGVDLDQENFKRKLKCPLIFAWVVFAISLIILSFSLYYIFIYEMIMSFLPVISCIIFFVIVFIVHQSIGQIDGKKYNIALVIFFIYLGIILFYSINNKRYFRYYNSIIIISKIVDSALKVILLIILLCFKKEFNRSAMPNNQEFGIRPQVL